MPCRSTDRASAQQRPEEALDGAGSITTGSDHAERGVQAQAARQGEQLLHGKRPVAAIIYKLTSHGNLSVNWQPYAVRPYSGDWKGHPIQESLGPHRPRSELFFMRDFLGLMSVLKSDADRERRFGFSEKSLSFIGSDLVSAIDAAIKESLEPYQCFVELRILNGIKCDTEKVLLEGSRYETPVITNASISKANMRALPIGD